MDNDDDDDRPRGRDRYPRTKEPTNVELLLRSLLERHDIPVPECMPEVLETTPPETTYDMSEPPPIDTSIQYRARAEQMNERGWPRRALEVALACDESLPGIGRVRAFKGDGAIVLSGDPGVGKTVAAAWWALRSPAQVGFVRAATLARSSRYGTSMDAILNSRALVIDDLGAEYLDAKGSFAVDLDELIDTFYADSRALIITTNCKASAFKQRYGARVMDRLHEAGAWAPVPGRSLRGNT